MLAHPRICVKHEFLLDFSLASGKPLTALDLVLFAGAEAAEIAD
jgi:hypothetical protein